MALTREEQHSLLERLALLVNMTTERGCTQPEADTAALKIGQLIQKYKLNVSFNGTSSTAEQPRREQEKPKEKTYSRAYDWARRGHKEEVWEGEDVEVIGKTLKALHLKYESRNEWIWIPISQLRNGCEDWEVGDSGTLYCSMWWARKESWV